MLKAASVFMPLLTKYSIQIYPAARAVLENLNAAVMGVYNAFIAVLV
jgi:hypothetical protein